MLAGALHCTLRARCKLQAASCKLQAASCKLQAASCKWRWLWDMHACAPSSKQHWLCLPSCPRALLGAGDPRRATCPQPSCHAPLPSLAASRLLPAAQLLRFQQLQAQRYLAAHPGTMRCCPQPSCGATLHLLPVPALGPAGPGAAGSRGEPANDAAAEGAAAASAAQGAGLGAACGACGHRFCWRCGDEAHEPASCEQMRQWGEELAVLRRAAPDADRQWLSSNTKRCPTCQTHIQASSCLGRGCLCVGAG
jgi:hypothetical protein